MTAERNMIQIGEKELAQAGAGGGGVGLQEAVSLSYGLPPDHCPGGVAVLDETPLDEDTVAWEIAKAGDLRPSDAIKIVKALQAGGWAIVKMSSAS